MNKPRLLIVDDESGTRNMLERAMSRRGFETRVAANVDEAQGIIARERFDSALLDLKIHHDSGLELIAPLRSSNPRARIVLLTGYSSIPTAVAAIKLGADDYLCKPAGGDQLVAALLGDPGARHEAPPLPDIASAPPSVNRLAWEHIQRVLAENDGNISATARVLGMHRRTLQRKLQKRPKVQ
ncbi:response regulator transcription factor [Microbulbifer harenosus]|uniref:Response regulator n=1 Tax=Microbulbifer harenosus TaxID=2576840 RepID=A0ABY2UH60_9GAMM|nr:response regulator [Microbulbifer harenosus]TLM77202.1 response regulator [Microbulbifer harenosus]